MDEARAPGGARSAVPDPPLSDGVVILVPFNEDHTSVLERAPLDPEIARRFEAPDGSPGQQIAQDNERWRDGTAATFAICDRTGTCKGGIGLEAGPVRRTDAGYWLLPEGRGKGLAARALALTARWALLDAGFERVQLWTEPDNTPAQRVAERAGFHREGVLRSYSDVKRTAMRRGDRLPHPL
ncbi:MAG TPA: GNAT family protein [Jiangellaceae bacterium]|nr:GNAT family protein [Jiangellaceae bacterium]